MAGVMKDVGTRDLGLRIASHYDHLAKRAEKHLRQTSISLPVAHIDRDRATNPTIVDLTPTRRVREKRGTEATPNKRSIVLNGNKTSVSVEDGLWHALREIAEEKSMTAAKLIEEINLSRRGSNLSSAIRVFVISERVSTRRERSAPHDRTRMVTPLELSDGTSGSVELGSVGSPT